MLLDLAINALESAALAKLIIWFPLGPVVVLSLFFVTLWIILSKYI